MMSWRDGDQPPANQVPANPPVAMFSAPGHPDTIWSNITGNVGRSRQIRWAGGTAATHTILSVAGAAEVCTRSLELHFSWNAGYVEADAASGKQLRAYRNRPRYGLILPPGTSVEFRIKEKSNYRFLAIELEPDDVLRPFELQHLGTVEIIQAWNYDHPLTWHLAQAIYEECENDGRQGLLYSETAITFLALHVIRNLSACARPQKFLRRGGLAPAILRRVCEYMAARLEQDISLSEIAGISGLSSGHFSFAFKQSMGLAPHAWLRRQRIERAQALLRDPGLNLASIGLAVGFANQSSFGFAFKKETGLSPSLWRRQNWL
jgi:AraC family transcriptional regulator